MSEALRTKAELEKLARVLDVDMPRLEPLAGLAAEDVRALRHQASDALFNAHRKHFERVAAAAKVAPAALGAKLAETALGPLLGARAAGLMDPGQARDLARRLSPGFLADLAVELDPRHATAVIAGIPAESIAEIAAELERREELIAMAGFLDHVSPAQLGAVLEALSASALLRVGFLAESDKGLEAAIASLSDECLAEIAEIALGDDRLEEAIGIALRIGDEQRARLATAAAAAGLSEKHLERIEDRELRAAAVAALAPAEVA